MACAERNVRPDAFPTLVGIAKEASTNPGPIGRLIAKAAAAVMIECGRGNTAPAIHLALISKQANWVPQYQETVNLVLDCIKMLEPMEKAAFNVGDAVGAGESIAKGVGYGTLGAGMGAGALWWLLSRHALQNDSKEKAMQGQVDYYQQLTSELDDQMRRRYGDYKPTDPKADPSKGKRRIATLPGV